MRVVLGRGTARRIGVGCGHRLRVFESGMMRKYLGTRGTGRNCIMRRFMICAAHQISGWSNQAERNVISGTYRGEEW